MTYPETTVIEKELKNDTKELSKSFIRYEENWHNGETFKYENNLNEMGDIRYSQFKTIITENEYFVYDEIIKINNKPILFLNLWNDATKQIMKLIIYFENDEVIQQIRHLSYKQFFYELENDELPIKSIETEDTTIIKMSFSDFIENINTEQTENKLTILEEETIKESKTKKYCWWIIKFIAFFGCIAISTIIGLVPTTVILGIAAIKPIAVAVSIGLGFIAIPWNNLRNKIVDWVFKKKKGKYEEEIERLKIEKAKQIQKFNALEKEIFLSLTQEAKQERILNGFQQIWEINKTKNFETLNKELSEKFNENKKELEKHKFAKSYEEKIQQWNENWQEKAAFSKSLKPRHIKKIKETFEENERNKTSMCDGYFYQPKETWDEFQEEKIIENMQELFENSEKNVNLKRDDIREKSPVTTMKKMVI